MSSASMQGCTGSQDSEKRFQRGDCYRHFVWPDSRRADENKVAHTL